MKRRTFLAGSLAAGGTAALAARSRSRAPTRAKLIRPKVLRPGDRVMVVNPSTAMYDPEGARRAESIIAALGWTPVIPPSLLTRPRDIAGSVEHRIAELHGAFADPSIRGVFCARGGYGVSEMIADVDFDLIGRNPKVFLGFSDLTPLHLAIGRKTGLATFHGRMPAMTRFPQYSLEALRRAVGSVEPLGILQNPSEADPLRPSYPLRTITPGKASGRLVGGNLAMILSAMGTAWEIDTDEAILFFEDVGEDRHAIARMLLTLKHAGKLNRVAGIVVGTCTKCDEPSSVTAYSLNEIFDQVLGGLRVPVFSGLALGHTEEQLTIPLGVQARMDATKCILEVVEPGVVA